MFNFKIALILLLLLSTPALAGTVLLMNVGKGTPGGSGPPTGNDLLVSVGNPMYSIGTTPILVQ